MNMFFPKNFRDVESWLAFCIPYKRLTRCSVVVGVFFFSSGSMTRVIGKTGAIIGSML